MSNDAMEPHFACPHCGAVVRADESTCWLCEKPVEHGAGARAPAPPRAGGAAPTPASGSYSISTLLLVTTIVAIVCGMIATAPGLGIAACIVLAPVLVRTALVVEKRKAAGKQVTMGEKVALIVTSYLVTNVILAVVAVAAVGTFCTVCLTAGTEQAIPVALLVAAGVTIPLLVLMAKWVRRRYRRDIGQG